MFSNLGSGEVVVIAIIILVFFGSKKLNELAKGLGASVKEINKIKKDIEDGISS